MESVISFDKNWKTRKEARYNHWVKEKPRNQIQFAFRKNWECICEKTDYAGTKVLEVGCGRGTISSYYADSGATCYLLDSSKNILSVAKEIFAKNNHLGKFICGNGFNLPLKDNTVDVAISIGLLEHFENPSEVELLIKEQFRVLKNNGRFWAYVVPKNDTNVQKKGVKINKILKKVIKDVEKPKTDVYVSEFGANTYEEIMLKIPEAKEVEIYGVYPLPMISNSPEFPFSLMSKRIEQALVYLFQVWLLLRRIRSKNPWICGTSYGQAFLVKALKEDQL